MLSRRHMTLDLRAYLGKSDKDLEHLLLDSDGNPMAAVDVRRVIAQAYGEGYTVLPVCDHHDHRGHCLGHPVEDPA